MKALWITLSLAMLSLQSCVIEINDNDTGGNGYYSCIDEEVDYFAQYIACYDFARVDKYWYQGEYVYVFFPGDCDEGEISEIKNQNCYSVGYLGGISNNEQVNGQNFYNHAHFEATIWDN
ncbi:MAG: DUF6970 domain-containing protein [Flavobacteriales bacterium]